MEGRAQQCCAPTDLLLQQNVSDRRSVISSSRLRCKLPQMLQQNVSDRRSVIVVVDTGRGEAAPYPSS